jgi:putative transposase
MEYYRRKRYLIHDRDPLYTTARFHEILKSSKVQAVQLPALSPDLSCYAERFVKSVKWERLNHLIRYYKYMNNRLDS